MYTFNKGDMVMPSRDYLRREMPWMLELLDNCSPLDETIYSCQVVPYGKVVYREEDID